MTDKHPLAVAWDEWLHANLDTTWMGPVGARLQPDRLYAAFMAGAAAAENLSPCIWTSDPIDGGWDAACGDKHWLTDGTPADNNMRFCPYCGRRLEEGNPAHDRP